VHNPSPAAKCDRSITSDASACEADQLVATTSGHPISALVT
jgi:hypothetical protein